MGETDHEGCSRCCSLWKIRQQQGKTGEGLQCIWSNMVTVSSLISFGGANHSVSSTKAYKSGSTATFVLARKCTAWSSS